MSRGARKLYTFELVEKFYHYLKRNVLRNGVNGRVIANDYGVWFPEGVSQASLMGTGTGLEANE